MKLLKLIKMIFCNQTEKTSYEHGDFHLIETVHDHDTGDTITYLGRSSEPDYAIASRNDCWTVKRVTSHPVDGGEEGDNVTLIEWAVDEKGRLKHNVRWAMKDTEDYRFLI